MGVDASVYCDCYEKGRVRKPPPQPELVYVDAFGQRCLKWDDPRADQIGYNLWLTEACEHGPMGELVSHRLGNAATIGFLRELLAETPERFPVLLAKVVYDGVHAGDSLSVDDVERLCPEIDRLRGIHSHDKSDEDRIRDFERQMSDLTEAARRVQKPIVF
jgi:hypothetical protein